MNDIRNYCENLAAKAKAVAHGLMTRGTADKNRALMTIALYLVRDTAAILQANAKDREYAASIGKTPAMIERLTLNEKRVAAMADAVREVAALPDPVGSGSYIRQSPTGLTIQRIRVPLGVVFMIFESRPNVTVDAASLTLKSGNTVILRGGKEAVHSNTILAGIIRSALSDSGFPEDAVQLVERTEHEVVDTLLSMDKLIDLVIPRGGENLIRSVSEKSRIPVIKHDKGVCHVFIDQTAERDMAEAIVVNAKCQRPSVCNAAESVLLHRDYPYKKEALEALIRNGVEIFADAELRALLPGLKEADESSWSTEYLDLRMSARVVAGVDEAIEHINRYGSHHSDAIVSRDYPSIRAFQERVDSAAVYANASTRFTDGGEFGMGAEVGISTQKLHARGPMGLEGLTCDKWVIMGTGQVRK